MAARHAHAGRSSSSRFAAIGPRLLLPVLGLAVLLGLALLVLPSEPTPVATRMPAVVVGIPLVPLVPIADR